MPTTKLLLHNREQKIRHELLLNNEGIHEDFRNEKFQKMAESPYAFFRGSNHLYWEDFYNDWRMSFFGGTSATLTWINGDAHVYNYGAYANHYGEAIFCMDDFDEAIVADYQFDLWRMAVSIVLDSRNNGLLSDLVQKKALKVFAESYYDEMISHNEDDDKNEVHLTKETSTGLMHKFLKKVEAKKNRLKMLDKWTKVEAGKRTFNLENEKLSSLTKEDFENVSNALEAYQKTIISPLKDEKEHFKIKDIVKRVKAGTGSLGSERYYILIEADSEAEDDDVILDMKEQGKAPLYLHMSTDEKAEYDLKFGHGGKRHALAFQALSEHPDRYLGWTELDGVTFSIKERSPFKCDFPTEKLNSPKKLLYMARVWGNLLASRHKRASYKLNTEKHEMPIAFSELAGDKRKAFKAMVTNIAFQYADRVKEDFQCFLKIL